MLKNGHGTEVFIQNNMFLILFDNRIQYTMGIGVQESITPER